MSTAPHEVETPLGDDHPFAPRPGLRIWMGNALVSVQDARISVFDHGLLYGDGVFEGIRIYDGRIFLEDEHVQRFFESAKGILLDIPMTPTQVRGALHKTMDANGVTGDGYIRLVATRGVGSLGLSIRHTASPTVFIIADTIALYPPEVYKRGLHCIISSIARNHPNTTSPRVKSLNYLNNIMAKSEAQNAGADEAIMLTVDGRVCECTGDNIFMMRNGELLTPPTSEGILEGLTRNLVIQLAGKRGIPVQEKTLLRHDLYIADECFATGTAAEVIAITNIDGRRIGQGKPGLVTRQIQADFVAYRNSC